MSCGLWVVGKGQGVKVEVRGVVGERLRVVGGGGQVVGRLRVASRGRVMSGGWRLWMMWHGARGKRKTRVKGYEGVGSR